MNHFVEHMANLVLLVAQLVGEKKVEVGYLMRKERNMPDDHSLNTDMFVGQRLDTEICL